MDVSILKDQLIVADDVFDAAAFARIEQEMETLRPKIQPTYHGTDVVLYRAVLDNLYPDRKDSFILQAIPEVLYGDAILAKANEMHNLSYTLINKQHRFTTAMTEMRGDTDYRVHTDTGDRENWTGIFLSWIWYYNPHPERYSGGILTVPELGVDVDPRNNRLVLLPAYLKHGINRPVFTDPDGHYYYRTTLNGFLTVGG